MNFNLKIIAFTRLFWVPATALLCSFLLLSGCGDTDEKKQDPAPKTHEVQIRCTRQGLNTSLGAKLYVISRVPNDNGPAVHLNDNLDGEIGIKTYLPFLALAKQDYTVTLSFTNVQGTQQVPSDALLKAEIFIDGQIRKTVQIDATTRPGVNSYVTASATVLYSEM